MQKTKILIRYQSTDSHRFLKTPTEAGLAEKVVRCVANLVQKDAIGNIIFNNSHLLHRRGEGYTYEVKFVRSGQSKSRRFTVYKLSGMNAKSECYQITDPKGQYIVVKIPPQPITEITAYLDAVVYERSLAQKLAGLGIKVVVPSISSVMRHLHRFGSATSMTASEMEEAYIELLRSPNNSFTDYFKIGGSFVFFMEYLDEPFLGEVVRDFHRQERLSKLKLDLVEKDFNLISKYNRTDFLSEYKNIETKKTIDEIYHELVKCYETFTRKLTSLFRKYSFSFDQTEKRGDLFIANLLGQQIDETSFPDVIKFSHTDKKAWCDEINNLIDQPTKMSGPITKYLEVLDHEAHWLAFKHNSQNIKKIGDNLLILLTKLEEMGLALRDLKIDNLFISNVDNMELGIIDLETGGDTGSKNIAGLVPAGMPGNMTVSNLLFISQLQKIYGYDSIGSILHMQDWYATVATMFEAVTGKTLFDDARDYIIRIDNEIEEKASINYHEHERNNPGVEADAELIESFLMLTDETIKGHTWNFFALAKRDLRRKSLAYSDRLKGIQFSLPDCLKNRILDNIDFKLQSLSNEYGKYEITDITGEFLDQTKAPLTVLRKNLALKKQLYITNKANSSVETSMQLRLLIELDALRTCIELKQKENLLIKKRSILEKKLVSAFALFPIMLDYIIEVMCRDEWQGYRPRLSDQPLAMQSNGDRIMGTIEDWKTRIGRPGDRTKSFLPGRSRH